jgi:hypothetical protein
MSRAPSGDFPGDSSVTYVSPDGGDGARIYDISGFDELPPRFPRLAVRLPSIPITAWPFLIVAIAVAVLRAQQIWTWGGSFLTVYLVDVLVALLPVALLIGCPRAWRSAPAVLVGVVAWVWVTSALALASEATQWIPLGILQDDRIGYALGVARDLAPIPAIAGPALIAYGLSKRRRTETTWPRAMIVVAIVVAAAWGLSGARAMLDFYGSVGSAPDGVAAGLTRREIVQVITILLRPVEILGLAAIAWSSLSAIRAGEAHRRFWALAFAGSTLLFGLAVYSNVFYMIFNGGSVPDDFAISVYSALSGAVTVAYLLAFAALIVAFALGLPPAPLDLGDVVAAE